MRLSRVLQRFSVLLAFALLVGASLSAAGAPRVSAYVVEPSGTVADGVAQGTFKISVTNGEASDATDFRVIFNEDNSVVVGDVAAGATVVSERVSIVMDISGMVSQNSPLQVTLRFTLNGATVEMPYNLTLARK